ISDGGEGHDGRPAPRFVSPAAAQSDSLSGGTVLERSSAPQWRQCLDNQGRQRKRIRFRDRFLLPVQLHLLYEWRVGILVEQRSPCERGAIWKSIRDCAPLCRRDHRGEQFLLDGLPDV